MSSRSFLLLIGAGGDGAAGYREFVLSHIAFTGHPIVLVDAAAPAWTIPYLASDHPHLRADLSDPAAVAAAVKTFAADHNIDGVMTYMEHHVVTAAETAQMLGLPTNSAQAMAAARDKATTRRLLDQYEVPSARAMEAPTLDAALTHADTIGYPVVVKPRSQAGSAGVVRADNRTQIREAYERASSETLPGLEQYGPAGVLVEECLEGAEISVETAVLGAGQSRILAVTRKVPAPSGTTQEYGHVIDAADPLLHDAELAHVISAAVDVLGLTSGVLCIEVMLTATGPRIVEVNGRLGGDLLPLLAQHALGIDLAQIATALATGTTPALEPTTHAAAAIRFAYPHETGVLERLAFHPDAGRIRALERAVLSARPGTFVSAPPHATLNDRLAHWVVTGQNAADCHISLDKVEQLLDVTITDPATTTHCAR
ncbi:ATP-grasp domain-containing protein [Streptomyces sp. NPDC101062]|uniref:ATP-grasp domain-containing protein n=1 Tax=unclassified Streptomyces TaxID=2593676 RepID=UPI00382ADDA9